MNTPQILPSMLAADFGHLDAETRRASQAGADALHIDVMDGRFVANISFGPSFVEAVSRATETPLHVHLMVQNPWDTLSSYFLPGVSTLLIHVESEAPLSRTLSRIREAGIRPALSINPETPVESVTPFLERGEIDEVLCMTVHPGFCGQSFIPHVLTKIQALRSAFPHVALGVDGGIHPESATRTAEAGASHFISGGYLFGCTDMKQGVDTLRTAATRPALSVQGEEA